MRPNQTFHGCVILLGIKGLFIRGKSGSGKTRLADLLVNQWQKNACFASWVVDDQVLINPHERGLIARAPKTIKGLSERRYLGIEPIQFEPSTRLDLIVDLVPLETIERLPEPQHCSVVQGEKELPLIQVPQHNSPLAFEIVQAYLQK